MKRHKAPNLLDKVPFHNPKRSFEVSDGGTVTIFIENRGPFNYVAQKLFGKPKVTQIHLEEYGSFLWQQIDGIKTFGMIAEKMKENFGEKIEPLYPRMSMYIKSLLDYDFIKLKDAEVNA